MKATHASLSTLCCHKQHLPAVEPQQPFQHMPGLQKVYTTYCSSKEPRASFILSQTRDDGPNQFMTVDTSG